MKSKKFMMMIVAAMAAMVCVAKETRSVGNIEIVDGEHKWRFVSVEGTSQLPIEYMCTGKNFEKRWPVTMDRYWIADKMVTEGEFAMVMGRRIRDGRKACDVLTDIEWEEALFFCERFSQRYSDKLPKGFIASMPMMTEWAHAVGTATGRLKDSFKNSVGTFLFTASADGGFLHTITGAKNDADIMVKYQKISKRGRSSSVGLRMVLVSADKGEMFADKELQDNTILSRGCLLAGYGYVNQAKKIAERLSGNGKVHEMFSNRLSRLIECVNEEQQYVLEDWDGMIRVAAALAEKKGFETKPYAEGWANRYRGSEEDADIVAAYRKAKIYGGFLKIGDLPEVVRKVQYVGEKDYISIYSDNGQELCYYEYTVSESNLVQVLMCDFTGDGKADMVVEDCRSIGSDGYNYSFYEKSGAGNYKCIDSMQFVGLCVLPRKNGNGCGFLVIKKDSNPILRVNLVTFKDGKLTCEPVAKKPFYMLDAKQDYIYNMAPFIGAGYGMGWRMLEGRGTWFSPLYWPWKPGFVWGYKAARQEADKKIKAQEKKGGKK